MIKPPWEFEDPLCSEVGDSFFFIRDKGDNDPTLEVSYEPGKSICRQCSHIKDCAIWGIQNEVHGLWGGLTPLDRKNIRKKLPIKKIA